MASFIDFIKEVYKTYNEVNETKEQIDSAIHAAETGVAIENVRQSIDALHNACDNYTKDPSKTTIKAARVGRTRLQCAA